MDVNQIVTIKLLNAISQANSNNKTNSSSQPNMFDFILQNTLGGLANSGGNWAYNNSSQGGLETLDTLLSTVNNNRVNTYENNKNINKAENNNTNIIKNNTIKEENNTVANNINSINNVSSSNNKMDDAVRLIESKVGNRYVWGATGPNTFDCSGLVQYVYKNALGKDIPRTSYEQSKFGQAVDKKNLQVGDLVFFDTMGKGRVSHVGMYVGNNEFVHAANSKDGIKKSKLTGYYETHYRGARRP